MRPQKYVSHCPSSPSKLETQISRPEKQCDKEREQREHRCKAAPVNLSKNSSG